MAGMNPMRYLNSQDSFERSVMVTIANRRNEVAADEREDLADRIINALSEAMNKK